MAVSGNRVELIDEGLSPSARRGTQLENSARPERAAFASRTVEVADGVEDHSAPGLQCVGALSEIVQNDFTPATARQGREFERRPAAVGSAKLSGAVEISRGVGDQ